MNKDIRVLTTFPRHPKTIKLKRILGTWEPIIVLWLWAAENRPNGDLCGLENEDIAIACAWDGEPSILIDALECVRFISRVETGAFVLHGWSEHNAYAANADKRSEKARLAAQARWDKRLNGCLGDAKTCPEDACSNAPSPTPSPNPILSPNKYKKTPGSAPLKNKEKNRFDKKTGIFTKTILDRCESISNLPQKNGKNFNPYQFVQSSVNNSIHPAAIVDALERINNQWDAISNPWTYGSKIAKVNSGNYCEREHAAESESFKTDWEGNDEIMALIRGIGG